MDAAALNLINELAHDTRMRWSYPEHGDGALIEREGTFKKLAVSAKGSLYIGLVETSRDGVSIEAYKNYTVCKVEALEVIRTFLSRALVFIQGVWRSLLSLLGLG